MRNPLQLRRRLFTFLATFGLMLAMLFPQKSNGQCPDNSNPYLSTSEYSFNQAKWGAANCYSITTGVIIQPQCPSVPSIYCTTDTVLTVTGCLVGSNYLSVATGSSASAVQKFVFSVVDPQGVTNGKKIWHDCSNFTAGSSNVYDIARSFGTGAGPTFGKGWPAVLSGPAGNKIFIAWINNSGAISASYVEVDLIKPVTGPGVASNSLSLTNTVTSCISNGSPQNFTFTYTGLDNLLNVPPNNSSSNYRFVVNYTNAYSNLTYNTNGTTTVTTTGIPVNGIAFSYINPTSGTLTVSGVNLDWTACAGGQITITPQVNNCGTVWIPLQTVTINLVPKLTAAGTFSAGATVVCSSPGTGPSFTYTAPTCAQGYITGGTLLQLQVSVNGGAYTTVGAPTTSIATLQNNAFNYVKGLTTACSTATYAFRVNVKNPVGANPNYPQTPCDSIFTGPTSTITSYPTLPLPAGVSITTNANSAANGVCSGNNATINIPNVCGALPIASGYTYSVSATVLAGGISVTAGTLPTAAAMAAAFTNSLGGTVSVSPTNDGSLCVVGQVRYDFTITPPAGTCAAQTYSVTVNVLPKVTSAGTLTYSGSNVCPSSNIPFTYTPGLCNTSGTIPGITLYQLQVSQNGGAFTNSGSATTNPASITGYLATNTTCSTATLAFRIKVYNPSTLGSGSPTTCDSAFATGGTVTVVPNLSLTGKPLFITSANTAVCSPSPQITWDYDYTKICGYINGITQFSWQGWGLLNNISGSVSYGAGFPFLADGFSTMNIGAGNTAGYFEGIQGANNGCGVVITDTVKSCVYPQITAGGVITGPSAAVCSGTAFNLTVNNVTRATNNVVNGYLTLCGGTTYYWTALGAGGGVSAGINTQFSAVVGEITSATNATFTPINNTCAPVVLTYQLHAVNPVCGDVIIRTYNVTVDYKPVFDAMIAWPNTTYCTPDTLNDPYVTIGLNFNCAGNYLFEYQTSLDGTTWSSFTAAGTGGGLASNPKFFNAGLWSQNLSSVAGNIPASICPSRYYRFRVTFIGASCTSTDSTTVLQVNGFPIAGLASFIAASPLATTTPVQVLPNSVNVDICGTNNTVTVSAPNNCNIFDEWQYSLNNGVSWYSASATTTTATFNNLPQTTWYRTRVSNGVCNKPEAPKTLTFEGSPNFGSPYLEQGFVVNANNHIDAPWPVTGGGSGARIHGFYTSIWGYTGGAGFHPVSVMILNNPTDHQFVSSTGATISPSSTGLFTFPSTPDWKYITYMYWNNLGGNDIDIDNFTFEFGDTNTPVAYSNKLIATVNQSNPGTAALSANEICTGNAVTTQLTGYLGGVLRWQQRTDPSFTNYPADTLLGSNSATYTTGALTASGTSTTYYYRAVVIYQNCTTYSNITSVVVYNTSVPGTLASSATVCSGINNGTINLSGQTGSVIKWQSSTDGGGTWSDITNTTTSLTYNNITATTQYRAVVQNGVCAPVNTTPVTITTVTAPIGGTATPATAIFCNGAASPLNLTLSGSSGTIQWQVSLDNGLTWNAASGTNNATTYAASPANAGSSAITVMYRARLSNSPCADVYSTNVIVTVNPTPTASLSPAGPVALCQGQSVNLNGSYGGVVSGATYNYYVNGTLTSSTSVAPDLSNLTPPVGATTYRVDVINPGGCAAVASNIVTVNVTQAPLVGSVSPASSTICNTGNQTLTLTSATGTITWEVSTNSGATWATASGSTNSLTYSALGSVGSALYRARVSTASPCTDVLSNVVSVTVNQQPTIGALSGATSVCASGNSGTITVASASGPVQWEYNTTSGAYSGAWNIVSGQSALSYNYSNLTATTWYRARVVAAAPCVDAVSNVIMITVHPVPVITSFTASASPICVGTGITLNASFTNTVTGVTTYQISGNNGAGILYATNTVAPSFPFPATPALGTTTYTITVTTAPCAPVTQTVTVVANPLPTVTLTPATNTICIGSNAGLTATISNDVTGATYELISSDANGVNTTPYLSKTALISAVSALTPSITTTYTVRVVNLPSCTTTASSTVTVRPVPVINTFTISASPICIGTSPNLNATFTDVVNGVTTYQITGNNGAGTVYASNTIAPSFPFPVTPAVGTTTYTLTVTTGPCAPVVSTVSVTVYPVPTPSISSPTPRCVTQPVVLTLSSGNTVSGVTTYMVTSNYPSANSVVYASSTTAPTSPMTVASNYVNPNGTTQFSYTVTNAPCTSQVVNTNVTVYPVPVINSLTVSATPICAGSSTNLLSNITNTVGGVTQYQIRASGATTGVVYPYNTIAPSASFAVTPNVGTTTYTLSLLTSPCDSVIATVDVVVNPAPTVSLTPSTNTICVGSNAGLTLAISNDMPGATYELLTAVGTSTNTQNYLSKAAIIAAVSALAPSATTTYTVRVVNMPSCTTTASSTITVHPVPVISSYSVSTSPICTGSSTNLLATITNTVPGVTTYTITASGSTTGIVYGPSTLAPGFPFSVTPNTGTTTYTLTVQTLPCAPATTSSVSVIVNPNPTVSLTPTTTTICIGSNAGLTLTVSNDNAGATYELITTVGASTNTQSYLSRSALQAAVSALAPTVTTTYQVRIVNMPACTTVVSSTVTVNPVPVVTYINSTPIICRLNASTISVSGLVTQLGASPSFNATVKSSKAATVYAINTLVTGGANPTGTFTLQTLLTTAAGLNVSTTDTTVLTFTYTATNGPGGQCSQSASNTVLIYPVPQVSLTPSTNTICLGSNAGLTANISSDFPGATYELSINGGATFTNYATKTLLQTTVANLAPTVTTTYVIRVLNPATNCFSTSSSTVTVHPIPTVGISTSTNRYCFSSNPITLNLTQADTVSGVSLYTITATGAGAGIIYASSTTSPGSSYNVLAPVGTTTYTFTITTPPCAPVSQSVTILIDPVSVGGTIAGSTVVCPGTNGGTLTLSGHVGSVIKWQTSPDNSTWTDVTNVTTNFMYSNLNATTYYRAVVQSGVCASANSAPAVVWVNTPPVANFTNTTQCFNVPPTVFTNTTTAGTSISQALATTFGMGTVLNTTTYSWNFGDPTSGANNISAATNPTHAYTTDGTFNVTMIATTTTTLNGVPVASCSHQVIKQVTVNPVTIADYTNNNVCLGNPNSIVISNFNSANTYVINWGDASIQQTVTSSPATRTFANPGQYSVRLRVTNTYGCSDSITKQVTAWALPSVTNVNISNTTPCAGSSISLSPIGDIGGITYLINPATGLPTSTVANSASITGYLWDFGDGTTDNVRNTTHTYALAGTYTVKLTITNSNGCSQTFTFSANPVIVQPIPVASFTATTVCLGFATTFDASASSVAGGGPLQYSWDYGDGSNSGGFSASSSSTKTYAAPGTYTVTLTVRTANLCTNTTTRSVTVNPRPLVNFTTPVLSACAGTTLTHSNTTTITSGTFTYAWRLSNNAGVFNFGSGTVSANADLINTYATAGTYLVRLYATSNNGCIDSVTKTITIWANPTAAITISPASGSVCIGDGIIFNSTGSVAGSGTIATYLWNFGDGSTSTAAGPITKVYTSAGTYTVTLTITNSNGCSNTTSRVVTVNPKPVVNFVANNACFGFAITFLDSSTVFPGNSYLWNFGDPASGASNTATTRNASHLFSVAGTFNVKLVVTTAAGCKDSITKSVTVYPRPVADFTVDSVCEYDAAVFVNKSTITSGAMNYFWQFGDPANSTSSDHSPTFTYLAPGTYSVKLTVTSDQGCIDSVRKNVVVKVTPKPTFTVANVCLRDAITVDTTGSGTTATSTYMFNYGDGTANTNALTHTYAQAGTYTITMTMMDKGCIGSTTRIVNIYELPLPGISASRYTLCVGEVDTFSNTSSINSGSIVSYKWDVINSSNVIISSSTVATKSEFLYTFTTAGVFTVRLTATSNNGCTDVVAKTITVNALPTVTIGSTNTPVPFHACLGNAHLFNSTGSTAGSGTIVQYMWDFGDGSKAFTANANHVYGAVGSYIVTLTITNSNGCSASTTQTAVVDPLPTANITPSNFPVEICNGRSITLTAPSGTGYSYSWSTGATTQNVTVSPTTSRWYVLTVTTTFGCSKTDSIYVTVLSLPTVSFMPQGNPVVTSKTDTISKGWSKEIPAFAWGSNGTFTYSWKDANGGTTGISNPNINNPVFNPLVTTSYTCTVTDMKGCTTVVNLTVVVIEDFNLKPSNLFTPNGDGFNDFWVVRNIENYPDAEVVIFNRWGEIVFQGTKYNNTWDGTYTGGGDVPDGTYYYIIRANGGKVIYKGNVTILRGK